MNTQDPIGERGYAAIADHALIGNLRTAALVSLDGSVDSYCIPNFDSPSVFARILDKDKGGHFSVTPLVPFTTKQNYLPSSNILQTKFMNEDGVACITDYLPRPRLSSPSGAPSPTKPLLQWLVRRVEVIRGKIPLRVECAPAFNYARDAHTTTILEDDSAPPAAEGRTKVLFESPGLVLDLRGVCEATMDSSSVPPPVQFSKLDLSNKGHKGPAAFTELHLTEGQCVTFVLRIPPTPVPATPIPPPVEHIFTHRHQERSKSRGWGQHEHEDDGASGAFDDETRGRKDQLVIVPASYLTKSHKPRSFDDPFLSVDLVNALFNATNKYWNDWIRQSTYTGSWKESVHRSALALKLLIYEPTGAVVASPTFSLPEYIGGTRNWDYRASWIRDSSFTLYALIRLGFTQEANAYLEFIFERLRHKNPDGSLQIMYTIHGGKDLEEIELHHLDGHKGSKPVRIGNGAADHIQLDIYGELMDCIYLGQKFGKPLSYDDWVLVRELVDFVVAHCNDPDLSIWSVHETVLFCADPWDVHRRRCCREVRNKKRHFTYSKTMLWVAIDRGLRLAEKRSLPCPNRNKWIEARDALYEDIMHKAWNKEGRYFGQSFEETDVLDSAVLIMPLVFFMQASDPRFISTLRQILKSPERGGLTSNNLVFRYDVRKSDDGVGGEEGTFCLCTLWCVEALTRAGEYDRSLLQKAEAMFEDFLLYLNHVGLCTEEISDAGEGLGNAVQGFTHVTLISAAYNLSRTMRKMK
ncbi:glycoside hydrolase family 15 protein [Pluteus cervinus]|uniref:Glycoside hydrolase family 15 protein n=1 Tax=Pluteus cervinus TaxID=181527 RepID=A0ACD3AU43_9AGAR|nr:glycoside hydrolase family 15 protein [Pluteus cervinus]